MDTGISPVAIGIDERCPEPPFEGLGDLSGEAAEAECMNQQIPEPPPIPVEIILDHTEPDSIGRLTRSLLPPQNRQEWDMVVANRSFNGPVEVILQWNPASIPADVSLTIENGSGTTLVNLNDQDSYAVPLSGRGNSASFKLVATLD